MQSFLASLFADVGKIMERGYFARRSVQLACQKIVLEWQKHLTKSEVKSKILEPIFQNVNSNKKKEVVLVKIFATSSTKETLWNIR